VVSGGPLLNEYNFLQLHMHWGETVDHGSEHMIDGRAFSGEVYDLFFEE
jgi:carbonic anhydrase